MFNLLHLNITWHNQKTIPKQTKIKHLPKLCTERENYKIGYRHNHLFNQSDKKRKKSHFRHMGAKVVNHVG